MLTEGERRRDANQRRAAHRQRLDQLDHVLRIAAIQPALLVRQQPLIEDLKRACFEAERHRAQRFHGEAFALCRRIMLKTSAMLEYLRR